MKLSLKIIFIVLSTLILFFLSVNFLILPLTENFLEVIRYTLVVVLAIIPAVLIILIALQKLIITPLNHINSIAKTIVSGNLSQRMEIKSQDEIGQLAENFNMVINSLTRALQSMANSLRDEKLKEKELAENYLQLDKAKAKDDALLTSIGDAVIAIDDQKKITLLNEAAGKMIGIDPVSFIGQTYMSILTLLNEKNFTEIPDFVGFALQGEKLIKGSRVVLKSRSGKMIPILYTISSILDNSKKVTGVVVVLKDITQERELEKIKDEFISVASHELRTPMTAIKGLISMIFEGDYGNLNEQLKDPLSDIGKSTERLIILVNDMLDVSRIETGRIKFNITEVSIPDVVKEVIKMLEPLSIQKNIKLEIVESPINKVSADVDKVKQILINLVNNSLKFTDLGHVTISFHPEGRFACISVSDTGIGISEENKGKLFGKFFQISSSQMGRPLGSGLGLYLSREFAKGMGGNMWLERSKPNLGTTFTFSLPFVTTML